MLCRHCQKANSKPSPAGLCWSCYYAPGVRDQYPSTSKFRPPRRGQTSTAAAQAAPVPDQRIARHPRKGRGCSRSGAAAGPVAVATRWDATPGNGGS